MGSPYRGKREDNHDSQHSSSPSLRTQFGGFSSGSKPFARKWNHGFRCQENLVPMADRMQRDLSNPDISRADTQANAGGGQACPNMLASLDRFDYMPCGCFNCTIRNRSVWVRVPDGNGLSVLEVQTRVRYGIESRFGRVDDVNHATKTNTVSPAMQFIVRFVSEDSVGQALAHGGGRIEEKGIKANICAMFRSKWTLLPPASQGHQTGPQDSIYTVYKAPPQRRGEMPFGQNGFMARGSPPAQLSPPGPFMNNSRYFKNMEPRHFGQGGHFQGKRSSRLFLNAEGRSGQQQPFHAFTPLAPFHGPPTEAADPRAAAFLPRSLLQAPKLEHAPSEMPFQSQPGAEEALRDVDGAARLTTMPQDNAIGEDDKKPRVSLPERPAATSKTAPEQCQSQGATDQPMPDAPLAPPRVDKSPVKQSKKKRQAAQLRASNQEGNRPATTVSGPPVVSASTTATTAAATVISADTAQQHAKEKEVRRPSMFTAEEIRDRKQAWDRIAVPLSSPRKHSLTAGDATVSVRPGHDRAKSLPVSALMLAFAPPTEVDAGADEKRTIGNGKEAPAPKSAEHDGKTGSSEEPASSAPSGSSPKKSSKSARKKKSKQDKLPAKKEHKL